MNDIKDNNIKEFKELIKTYESLTVKTLKGIWKKNGNMTMGELTGFNHSNECTLCVAVKGKCMSCVYNNHFGCTHGKFSDTFHKISITKSPVMLRKHLLARIKLMKELIK